MVINIYTAREGDWSVTAIVSFCVAGSYGLFMGGFLFVFECLVLKKFKRMS